MKEPNFFILGAPKCGTTAMASYLSEHPEIFMTDPKEPHYYNTDQHYGAYKDRKKYLSLFSEATGEHKMIGEASTWYLHSETAVPNIMRDYPDARFIVMLRNPLEMAPSLYRELRFGGRESSRTFQEAWELQCARRKGQRIPRFCKEPSHLLYKEVCSLGRQFDRLLRHVDRQQILAIVHDDFKAIPDKVWKDVVDFLQVAYIQRSDFPPVNTAKVRRSLILKRLNDLYAYVRTRVGFPGLGTGLFSTIDDWNRSSVLTTSVNLKLLDTLKAEFRPDVFLLSDLLGRDLSHWVEA